MPLCRQIMYFPFNILTKNVRSPLTFQSLLNLSIKNFVPCILGNIYCEGTLLLNIAEELNIKHCSLLLPLCKNQHSVMIEGAMILTGKKTICFGLLSGLVALNNTMEKRKTRADINVAHNAVQSILQAHQKPCLLQLQCNWFIWN